MSGLLEIEEGRDAAGNETLVAKITTQSPATIAFFRAAFICEATKNGLTLVAENEEKTNHKDTGARRR